MINRYFILVADLAVSEVSHVDSVLLFPLQFQVLFLLSFSGFFHQAPCPSQVLISFMIYLMDHARAESMSVQRQPYQNKTLSVLWQTRSP